MKRLNSLKGFNAFPRAEEHLFKKTLSGAFVTLLGVAIILTLFVHELKYYLTTINVHEMSVNVNRGETLPIHVNMSFPSLPCQALSVDAVDMSGKHEVDMKTNIWKLRLDKYGKITGTDQFMYDLVKKELDSSKHGESSEHHGDSTEMKQEYEFDEAADNFVRSVKNAMENGEGCRVYGVLDVQRVAGNFRISVNGLSPAAARQIFGGPKAVNASHVVHELSFGFKFPGLHNPLDGTNRIIDDDIAGTFKYYIKIVPTEYRYLSSKVLPTNQFSVTEYFLPAREADKSWPAVYFLYDLSPISVTIKEERRSFLHFITHLCAVLGGTFALTGMLDKWMYGIIEGISKTRAHIF